MQTTLALLSLAAAAGLTSAQGIPAGTLKPATGAPPGCTDSYSGSFEITVVKPSAKRDLSKRADCATDGVLVASLSGGVLTDSKGRIGGIVANRQFQFDGPPSQTGTIYNGGFSVCSNGSLAIGGNNIFYQCLSGTFYNLYDESTGAQCQPVIIDIIPCGTPGGVEVQPDGQPTGPAATNPPPVTQISDGQAQAQSATPVSQFTDGQIQVTGQPGTVTPVAQITDGQIQATTAGPPPVSQISDGQVQATPAGPPVSQITDGQIQATSAGNAPVSQISDGQIQATTLATQTPVAQITDGQIQAGNSTATSSMPAQFTGAANAVVYGAEVLVGAIAVAAFAVL